jgi:hypothetical protein
MKKLVTIALMLGAISQWGCRIPSGSSSGDGSDRSGL